MFTRVVTTQTARQYNPGVTTRHVLFVPVPIFALLILAFVASVARVPAASANIPSAVWREDVQGFTAGLIERHKNAFHTVSRPVFMAAARALEDRVATLEDHEVVVGLMGLAALVGDGHTFVADSTGAYLKRRLPVRFEWLDGALHVTGALEPYRRALGARLVAVNNQPLATVLSRLETIIAKGESPGWVRFLQSAYLSRPEILHALGLSNSPERASFKFEQSGNQFTISVNAVQARSLQELPLLDAAQTIPLRRKQRDALWFEYLPDTNAMYFAFNAYPPSPDFYRFSETLLKALENTRPDRLVIDLRDNTGGDFTRFEWLLTGIRDNPRINRRGHLFVLIGDKTFSAAMVNAVQLRQRTNAILIGEPTGARPNSYSENGFFTLPNSGLTISVSTLYYTFIEGDDPPGVPPDVFVAPSLAAYLAGRDPVLETALTYQVH